jgi:tetrahydromethanopterin S-methyltransferase subunit F
MFGRDGEDDPRQSPKYLGREKQLQRPGVFWRIAGFVIVIALVLVLFVLMIRKSHA